jgi:hypothetical protein
MKLLAILTAATLTMGSAALAAPQNKTSQVIHPPKAVNTNVNHGTKQPPWAVGAKPVTKHLTPQQRHDAASKMYQRY